MKIVNVIMAVFFVCVLGLSTLPAEVSAKSATKAVISEKIDINSASEDLLTQLPGIGPKTATLIVNYRAANSGFKSVDDLKNVKGIGDKTLAKLRPFLKRI